MSSNQPDSSDQKRVYEVRFTDSQVTLVTADQFRFDEAWVWFYKNDGAGLVLVAACPARAVQIIVEKAVLEEPAE